MRRKIEAWSSLRICSLCSALHVGLHEMILGITQRQACNVLRLHDCLAHRLDAEPHTNVNACIKKGVLWQ